MDSEVQKLIDELKTVKSNLKSKIQSVLGKNLSNVTFENYYRYITIGSSLNPQKTYTSVPDTIAGKLQRINQVKQFLKEAIEDNLNQNLTNVSFKNYHNYIKKEYSLKSLKEPTFYQGWKYRVQVLLNGKPAGEGISGTFTINDIDYQRTTDKDGIISIAINLNPGPCTVKTVSQGKTLSESVTVTLASQSKTARSVSQGSTNSSRGQTWENLTATMLSDDEPNNYASCNYIAGKNGTRNTPYYVDLYNFGFSLPSGATIKNIEHRTVMRMNHTNITENGEFDVNIYTGTADPMAQNSSHTLLASSGTSWQYFTPFVGNVGNYSAPTVNSQSFKTRLQFGANKTTNPCGIAFTFYKITIYYSPPQNI